MMQTGTSVGRARGDRDVLLLVLDEGVFLAGLFVLRDALTGHLAAHGVSVRHAAPRAASRAARGTVAAAGGTVKQLGKFVRVVIGIGVVVVAVLLVGRLAVSVAGREPFAFGLDPDAERGGCPGTPNCVSTYAETTEHAIEPIQCDADTATAIAVFTDAIGTLPDVEQTGPQSWVVYSRIMRFPDDVRIDVTRRGIEVISASRLGSSDLGVNRRRVDHLRELVTADERCQ